MRAGPHLPTNYGQGRPRHRWEPGHGVRDMTAAGVRRARRRPDGAGREEGRRGGRQAPRARPAGRRVPPAGHRGARQRCSAG